MGPRRHGAGLEELLRVLSTSENQASAPREEQGSGNPHFRPACLETLVVLQELKCLTRHPPSEDFTPCCLSAAPPWWLETCAMGVLGY